LISGVAAACTFALVQSGADREPIVTDRPDFTESAVVVPLGMWQVECGATYRWFQGGHVASGPELLLRHTLALRTEIRIGVPDRVFQDSNSVRTEAWADAYLGVKLQLGPLSNGDDFALIPAISIPSGTEFSSGSYDPELKACWSRDLSSNLSLSLMAVGSVVDRELQFTQTASLGIGLGENLSMFTEYALTAQRGISPSHVLHVGMARLLGADAQVDIHGGFKVGTSEPEPFIAFGYAVRF